MRRGRYQSGTKRQPPGGNNFEYVTEPVYFRGRGSVFGVRPSHSRSSERNNQSHFHLQRAFTSQTNRPNFRTRANHQAPSGDGNLFVRPNCRNNPSSNGSLNSHGDFRGVIRTIFQQSSLAANTSCNSNQNSYRQPNIRQNAPDEHRNCPVPVNVNRPFVYPRNHIQKSEAKKSEPKTPKESDPNCLSMHKNACATLSSLPAVCCEPVCTTAIDSWVKVILNGAMHNRKNSKEPLGWFFMSTTRPIITLAQNTDLQAFPHYHIYRPLFSDPYQIGRKMQTVHIPNKIATVCDSFNFSVLSYNILSDDLLWENTALYRDCPGWTLQWNYRKENLLKELESYNADILCFQEVKGDHFYRWFLPELHKRGYLGEFKKRTGVKLDGCAVFYRKDRFSFRERREIEYRISGHSLMDRDNIGLVVALEPKEYGRISKKPTIFVANTHLLFNKNRGDIKLLQLAKLLSEIDEMSKFASHLPMKATAQDAYNPVILCGDFNSTPLSPLYEFLTKGRLKYEGLSRSHMSGQNPPSRRRGSETYFSRDLIPNVMNISNLCQKVAANCGQNAARGIDSANFIAESDDCIIVGETIAGKTVIIEEPGVLKHLLRLQSAYKFDRNNLTAATSSQGVVDYIMFSQGMERTIAEQMCSEGDIFVNVPRKQLYLTGVLALPSSDDLTAMHSIPNPVISSDHFALLATFRLLE